MICNSCNREIGNAPVCPYCHTPQQQIPPYLLPQGTVIGGKYVIQSVLGEGGFGITYLGTNTTLHMTVAVKEYFPRGFSYRNATVGSEVVVSAGSAHDFYERGKQRFLSEARTLARFSEEPGIVSVLDFIEANNTAYLIMEYLEGVTLQEHLKRHGKLSAEETFALLEPVMRTLDKVHQAGVIHRDISPDNIMMLNTGELKLMDFGAAKEFVDETRSMSVMLKKGYAPEEQYRRNGKQGPWTDVYALCATIYRCITGTAPEESLDRLRSDDLIPPSRLGADISPTLESILLYGLAVYRSDRCQSMEELLRLYKTRSTPPVRSNSLSAAAPDTQVTMLADRQTVPAAVQPPTKKNTVRNVSIICAVAVLLVIAIAAGIIFMNPWKNKSSDTTDSTENPIVSSGDASDPDPVEETQAESLESILQRGYWIEYSPQYYGFYAFTFSDGTYTRTSYSFDNGEVQSTGIADHTGAYTVSGSTVTLSDDSNRVWEYTDGEMLWSWTDTLPDNSQSYNLVQIIYHHDEIPDAATAQKEREERFKNSTDETAAPSQTQPQSANWKTIYLNYLEAFSQEHSSYVSNTGNSITYSLIYVDDDDVPELVIGGPAHVNPSYFCWIRQGTVSEQQMGAAAYQGVTYLPSGGLVRSYEVFQGNGGEEIYRLSDGELTQIAHGSFSVLQDQYKWNDTAVDKSEYESSLNAAFDTSRASDAINSSYSYDEIVKLLQE